MDPRADTGPAFPEPRFGLKWKAFSVLLALLASVHLTVGVLSYRNLVNASQRQQQARMASFPAVLDELTTESANALANVAAVLASSIGKDDGPGDSARPLPSQIGANLVSAEYFDENGERLGRWDLIDTPSPADPAALAEVRQRHQPTVRIVCATECLLQVFVPVFGRDEQELIIALAAPLADILPAFQRLTGAHMALLARRPAATGNGGLARYDGRDIVALTDAASLLPQLRALAHGGAGSGYAGSPLVLHEAPLAGTAPGSGVGALFIVDQSETLSRIEQEFWRSIRFVLVGLTLSGLVLYLLLAPPMRRLQRITGLLPLLAERRFDEVRSGLAPARRLYLPDEIDTLRITAMALTERLQRLDAAEAASEAKSRFLAVMSHEIRTPMNGVLGMLELLARSPLDDHQRDTLRVVSESAQALLRVIDDILDFSKIEAGRIEIEQTPFNLAEVLEGTVETLTPALRGHQLRLLSYVDPAIPPRLLGDPVRMRQILFNLIGNALKFTEQGFVLVHAERCMAPDGRIGVRFRVEDSGIGISAEAQQRLFEPFVQAESSTTRRYGGTGLGLSISRNLVQRMGGSLQLRSTPGSGSCFWFELAFDASAVSTAASTRLTGVQLDLQIDDPREAAIILSYAASEGAVVASAEPDSNLPTVLVSDRRASGDEAGRDTRGGLRVAGPVGEPALLRRPYRRDQLLQTLAVAAGRALATESGPRPAAAPAVLRDAPRVLVAEDHPINRQVIVAQLGRLGYAADVAEDGEAALELLRSGTYVALLTDLQMPRMDGYMLAQRQRQREASGEAAGHLPIIALSANVLQGQAQRCLEAGMDDYLGKPVVLRELQGRLQGWLRQPTQATAGGTGEPVDLALLKDCMGDDMPAIRQLLRDFLRINTPLMGELQERMRSGAADEIRALAHRLLGSARTAGATQLALTLACIENAAEGADREVLSDLWTQAAREFAVVRDWTGRALVEATDHPLPG